MNFSNLFLEATIYVQVILFLLVLSSIFSWAIIFNRSRELKKHEKVFKDFESVFWGGKNIHKLYQDIRENSKHSIGIQKVFAAGHDCFTECENIAVDKQISIGRQHMAVEIKKNEMLLDKYLDILATISSNSPYVGLLGTVIGIMNSFMSLDGSTGSSLEQVAPGVAEALFATGIALVVACPASIAYNILVSRKEKLVETYDLFVERYINVIEKKLNKKRA
jgi:biopolymer transport protein TolQ